MKTEKNIHAIILLQLIFLFLITGVSYSDQMFSDTTKTKSAVKSNSAEIKNADVVKTKDNTKIKVKENQEALATQQTPINVEAIDKNKDGKLYQCPMDWNELSDKPSNCDKCKMSLVEISVANAKKYLVKHGYKVK